MGNIYDDIADLYDSYLGSVYDVAFFVNRVKPKLQVLELTSGIEHLSLQLVKAGAELTCVDLSKKMRYLHNKYYLNKIH